MEGWLDICISIQMLQDQSVNKDLMLGVILGVPGDQILVLRGEKVQNDGVFSTKSDVILQKA